MMTIKKNDKEELITDLNKNFGGINQCDDNDNIHAITNCNLFETVTFEDLDDEIMITVSDSYYDKGEDIRNFINEFNEAKTEGFAQMNSFYNS